MPSGGGAVEQGMLRSNHPSGAALPELEMDGPPQRPVEKKFGGQFGLENLAAAGFYRLLTSEGYRV